MRLHIRMNTQLVDLQIRPSDKRLVASDHITLKLLINLCCHFLLSLPPDDDS